MENTVIQHHTSIKIDQSQKNPDFQ